MIVTVRDPDILSNLDRYFFANNFLHMLTNT